MHSSVHILIGCTEYYLMTANWTSHTHPSIILQSSLAELLLSWSFSLPSYYAVFQDEHILVDPNCQPCLVTQRGFLRCRFVKILSFSVVVHWLIFWAIFTTFILTCLEFFFTVLDVIMFPIFKKNSVFLRKNICVLTMENFSVLKNCISIVSCEMVENFCKVIFWGLSYIFSSTSEPQLQNIIIRCENDFNRTSVFSWRNIMRIIHLEIGN